MKGKRDDNGIHILAIGGRMSEGFSRWVVD